jgi:hypothetical protein
MWKDGKLVQITGKALTDIKQHMENHGGQTGSDPSLPQCNAQSQNGMKPNPTNQCTDEIVNSKYSGSKIHCCAQLSNKLGTGKCAFGCVDDNGGECVPCEGIVLGARRTKKKKEKKQNNPGARRRPRRPRAPKKAKKTEAPTKTKPTKKMQTPKKATGGTTAKDTGSHTSWVLKALGIFSVALVLAIIVAVIMRHYCNSKRLMYAAR